MNIITYTKFKKKKIGYSEAYPYFNDINMTNTKKQVSHSWYINVNLPYFMYPHEISFIDRWENFSRVLDISRSLIESHF